MPLHTIVTKPGAADAGSPVVLVHGFAGSAKADFSELAELLAFRGHRVIAVELPGHGGAAAPTSEAEVRPSALVAELAAVIDSQPEPRVDVVGYSMGARLAWELPAVAPKLGRLVLGGLAPVEPFAHVDRDVALAALRDGSAPPDPLTGMIVAMATLPGNRPHELLTVVAGLAAEPFDPEPGFGSQTPTLIIVGDADEFAQGSAPFAARLANGAVVSVPGDHLASPHSAEFADAVAEFFSD